MLISCNVNTGAAGVGTTGSRGGAAMQAASAVVAATTRERKTRRGAGMAVPRGRAGERMMPDASRKLERAEPMLACGQLVAQRVDGGVFVGVLGAEGDVGAFRRPMVEGEVA